MAITTHETTTGTAPQLRISSLGRPMLILGIVLIAITGIKLFGADNHEMYASYMFGVMFWMSLTLGLFGMSILHHCVRGRWSVPFVRLMEAGGGPAALLTMAVLFLPFVLNPGVLYDWADPVKRAADHVMNHRSAYMNPMGFTIRYVAFFAIWIAYSWFMRRSVLRQEAGGGFKLEISRTAWGAAGIVMFFLTVTFALTDWLMSMDNHWFSTMYGTWFIIMSCGAGLAFCLMIFNANSDKEPYRSVISPTLTRDQGNMQFTLTMLWGYTSLSQFLIIWNGNIPETTSYYKNRSSDMFPPGMASNHWGILGMALMIGRFFIPFFALLSPRIKKYPENLRLVGGWILVMHFIEIYLLVQPSIPGRAIQGPFAAHFVWDLLAWAGVGAIWIAVFALQTAKAPLVPTYDHRLEAMKHAH
ncbi:hypothetical protein [Fimbriimonas ginsengisoli]|uniref:Quinol:cytochrome c oxidoreductase quinone-binding subunit 2 n=1 Tax=Fimbriimonas ginsengisoli Gsoil 348 TaxID=661478 RepID=A0A068NPV2_FIMGI|nr:hypothetical protein [Fimbriimonas ginsengisoli]AIE85553.1 hypothetical protein OP10G_2185 [Fimbriimonas ginsengisoli Gsoil 348]